MSEERSLTISIECDEDAAHELLWKYINGELQAELSNPAWPPVQIQNLRVAPEDKTSVKEEKF